MNKQEFDEVLEFLKSKGFKISDKYKGIGSHQRTFEKTVKTNDEDIELQIHGELRYYVSEK